MRGLIVVALVALLAASVDATAQTSKRVIFSNAELSIPLKPGTTLDMETDTTVIAECVTASARGGCVLLDREGVPLIADKPTATLTCSGCATARVGSSAQLSWSSERAEVCVASTSVTGYPTWNGGKPSTGSQSITFAAAGRFALRFKCYNTGGSSPLAEVSVTVAP